MSANGKTDEKKVRRSKRLEKKRKQQRGKKRKIKKKQQTKRKIVKTPARKRRKLSDKSRKKKGGIGRKRKSAKKSDTRHKMVVVEISSSEEEEVEGTDSDSASEFSSEKSSESLEDCEGGVRGKRLKKEADKTEMSESEGKECTSLLPSGTDDSNSELESEDEMKRTCMKLNEVEDSDEMESRGAFEVRVQIIHIQKQFNRRFVNFVVGDETKVTHVTLFEEKGKAVLSEYPVGSICIIAGTAANVKTHQRPDFCLGDDTVYLTGEDLSFESISDAPELLESGINFYFSQLHEVVGSAWGSRHNVCGVVTCRQEFANDKGGVVILRISDKNGMLI